jgi:hypothetical protein
MTRLLYELTPLLSLHLNNFKFQHAISFRRETITVETLTTNLPLNAYEYHKLNQVSMLAVNNRGVNVNVLAPGYSPRELRKPRFFAIETDF